MLNLSKYAIGNRAITHLAIAIIIIGGIYSFLTLGKREDSTFTIKSAVITCSYAGATPDIVERYARCNLSTKYRPRRTSDMLASW